ncbi:MAG: tetratricopeptide repeat protein [Myxococcales bacterium]|nr:tetratricopeptide repeat protein [Myxococcales bacterium]
MSTAGAERKKKSKKSAKGAKKGARAPSTARPWWIVGVVCALLVGATAYAWKPREVAEPNVKRGNERYRAGQFEAARDEYEAAPGAGPRFAGVHTDRGLARFRLAIPTDGGGLPLLSLDGGAPPGVDQAQEAFRTAARGGTTNAAEDVDAFLRARAAFNLANTFFSTRSWDNAIDSYKEALRLRPGWTDAAWNLELARRLREQDRNPPDAGQDASQDAEPNDASQPPRDANDGDGGNNRGDGGQNDGGQGRGDGGNGNPDGSNRSDGGSQGDSGMDGGAPPPESSDGGNQPPSSDASAPRTMAPLDQLERSSRSLQQEMMRRRGIAPRSPDDDR